MTSVVCGLWTQGEPITERDMQTIGAKHLNSFEVA